MTHTAERDALATLREGVEAVISDRYAGDFAAILPKLRTLLDDPRTSVTPPEKGDI